MQIIMLLPTQLPVDSSNMNYTCVTVGAVMILVMGAWYLPYWGAKNWVCPHIISAAQRTSDRKPVDIATPPAVCCILVSPWTRRLCMRKAFVMSAAQLRHAT